MRKSVAPRAAATDSNAALVERLHQAVQAAGGNQAVAERSGVPLGTVNNYVAGRHGMKIQALAALATACGVSLQWLVSGDEAAEPGFAAAHHAAPPGLAEPPPAPAPVAASGTIDVPSLAKAIEIVRAIAGNASLADEPKLLARRIASAYLVLTQPPTTPD